MHGCLYTYGGKDCTVYNKRRWQSHPCETCEYHIDEIWEVAHLENEIHDLKREIVDLKDGYDECRDPNHI